MQVIQQINLYNKKILIIVALAPIIISLAISLLIFKDQVKNLITGFVYTPELSIVGLWHLDSNALDSSGNNNHGKVYGATPTAGKIKNAYYFDGIDDYILVGDSSSLSPKNEVGVSVWIKPDILNQRAGIVWKHEYNYILHLERGEVKWEVWDNQKVKHTVSFPESELKINDWNLITATYSEKRINLYLNKVLKAGSVGGTSIRDLPGDLFIGKRPDIITIDKKPDLNQGSFKGAIDEVVIFNRVFITPSPTPSPTPTPSLTPTPTPQEYFESFETGFGGWIADYYLQCEFNKPPCLPLEWDITRSTEQAHNGIYSLRGYLNGDHDGGAIWTEKTFPVPQSSTANINLSFQLWSERASDLNQWPVVAYIGFADPEQESDFTIIGNTDSIAGWQVFSHSRSINTGSSDSVWVAFGFGATWEIARTYFMDSVSISIR